MKKALALLLALAFAAQADARALFITSAPTSANQFTGLERIKEAALGTSNTLGGSYDVKSIWDAPDGATQALRRGAWYPNAVGADSVLYGLVVILGEDKGNYTGTITNTGRETSSGGLAYLRTTNAAGFQYLRPGALVSGTGITDRAKVVSIDSLYQRMLVQGTVAGGGNITLTWSTPIRPDSLTLTYNATAGQGYLYPKVPILRIGQFMGITGGWTRTATCSTGVTQTTTYSAQEDSTRSVYDVGNHYRSWKARQWYAVEGTRDPRGWRPILGSSVTRAGAGGDLTVYDFVDAAYTQASFSGNPDTVAVWAVMNWGADGTPIRGDAKPNIYATISQVNGTNTIDPGTLLVALGFADSVSGGALFGSSQKLPRQMAFHIDDGWKRGDSRFNVGGAYGGIGLDDTTAFKASIDSLAALRIPFVVGVEVDSLDSVLLAAGVTGHGDYYDKRWWARAPLARYTPHSHAGLTAGTNRAQNTGTIGAAYSGKYLRVLDIWGLSRTRYAFGSPDSALAYGVRDHWNDIADTAATYWLNKRAFGLLDSTFGARKVDRLVMPPGDDWTNFQIKHTRRRQHGLGVDSVMASAIASGALGIRMNAGINVFGNDDSTVTNNYGWWTVARAQRIGLSAGDPGSPAWLPARLYGHPCHMVPTDGYPANSSKASWSTSRTSYGGEKFLSGLLFEHVNVAADPTTNGRGVYVLASHASDFGSSGFSGMQTRPMFYTFKYVTNAIRTANARAGRELVRFVYPDEIRP